MLEQGWEFVQEWLRGDWSKAELCREFGVSRRTGYKWMARYEEGGMEALSDRSRAPQGHRKAVSEQMQERIVEMRAAHPSWGAPKIRARLGQLSGAERVPAESTIGEILKRHGLTVRRRQRRQSRPSEQPLAHAGAANQVWCADFKGWFRTQDGKRIDPLTITDAYSRYLLRCQAVRAADALHSQAVFTAAFREYGLPERIRTDNGAPFASNGESGLSTLSVWWIKLGIVPERIAPGRPRRRGGHRRSASMSSCRSTTRNGRMRRWGNNRRGEFMNLRRGRTGSGWRRWSIRPAGKCAVWQGVDSCAGTVSMFSSRMRWLGSRWGWNRSTSGSGEYGSGFMRSGSWMDRSWLFEELKQGEEVRGAKPDALIFGANFSRPTGSLRQRQKSEKCIPCGRYKM